MSEQDITEGTPGRCFPTFQSRLTFPLQVVAIVDELQRVRLVGSLHVIYVDVQVVGRFQEVVGEHRPFALIQGEVHVGGDQSATLPLSHGLAYIQRGGRIWRERPRNMSHRGNKFIHIHSSVCVYFSLTGSVVSEAT